MYYYEKCGALGNETHDNNMNKKVAWALREGVKEGEVLRSLKSLLK